MRYDGAMSAILYPVADNAEQALSRPAGRAARERPAQKVAGEAVAFVTEAVGPAFPSREAALAAYRGRLEEEGAVVAPEDRFLQLVERLAPVKNGRAAPPSEPPHEPPGVREGHRWPDPPAPPVTVWRLVISYWRPVSQVGAGAPQARVARRSEADYDRDTLKAMTKAPLAPVKPQQALDIGLFETRLPEAPHIVVPDE
jgi:hypothetical protein